MSRHSATGIVSPATTRVLLAVVAVHQRDGRSTIRSVATQAGRCVATTYRHLLRLRDLGLVAWDETKVGTLRPTVREVSQ